MSSKAEPSRCRTTLGEKEEATFTWTIDRFKNRPEKCVEELKSPSFTRQIILVVHDMFVHMFVHMFVQLFARANL